MTTATFATTPTFKYDTVRERSVLAATFIHGSLIGIGSLSLVYLTGAGNLLVAPVGNAGIGTALFLVAVCVVQDRIVEDKRLMRGAPLSRREQCPFEDGLEAVFRACTHTCGGPYWEFLDGLSQEDLDGPVSARGETSRRCWPKGAHFAYLWTEVLLDDEESIVGTISCFDEESSARIEQLDERAGVPFVMAYRRGTTIAGERANRTA